MKLGVEKYIKYPRIPCPGFRPCQPCDASPRSFSSLRSFIRSFPWVSPHPWIPLPTSTNARLISSTSTPQWAPWTSMAITSRRYKKLTESAIPNVIPSAGMGGNHIRGYKFPRIWGRGCCRGLRWSDNYPSKPRTSPRLSLRHFNGWVAGFGDVLPHPDFQKFALDSWTSKAQRCCKSIWGRKTFKKCCGCSGGVSASPSENWK